MLHLFCVSYWMAVPLSSLRTLFSFAEYWLCRAWLTKSRVSLLTDYTKNVTYRAKNARITILWQTINMCHDISQTDFDGRCMPFREHAFRFGVQWITRSLTKLTNMAEAWRKRLLFRAYSRFDICIGHDMSCWLPLPVTSWRALVVIYPVRCMRNSAFLRRWIMVNCRRIVCFIIEQRAVFLLGWQPDPRSTKEMRLPFAAS